MTMSKAEKATMEELALKNKNQAEIIADLQRSLATMPGLTAKVEELMAALDEGAHAKTNGLATEIGQAKMVLPAATAPSTWVLIDPTTHATKVGAGVVVKDSITGAMVHCPGVQIITHPDGKVELG